MKQFYLLIVLAIIVFNVQAQTYQESIGGAHTTSAFNSVGYDSTDGGTISAGYIYDSTKTNGRDWYLVKLDKNKNIVWQKTIQNSGDDFIYKVIVCKNGDYVAVGVLNQSNTPRGFICRLNSLNGNVIWSTITENSFSGEICYDVVETNANKLAVAATDQWLGSPNCFIILLNSAGKTIWSKISQYPSPDQPYSIGQLPNRNLLIGINEWVGGHYNLILAELSLADGSIVKENSYAINATIPNSGLLVNSLASWGMNTVNNQVSLYCYAFQGSSSVSNMCLYTYNTSSKKLTGNILYHANDINTIAFNYTPVGTDDFVVSESFANPTNVYVSRITNGYVVYDDKVKGAATQIKSLSLVNGNVVYAGSSLKKNHDNSYNLFAPVTDPIINTACNIASSKTLNLIPSVINPVPVTDISFVNAGIIENRTIAFASPTYKATLICGDSTSNATNTVDNSMISVNNLEKKFNVYPNPAGNIIHIDIPKNTVNTIISIYDMTGSKRIESQVTTANVYTSVDISKLETGVYNVVLLQGDKRYSTKLTKL